MKEIKDRFVPANAWYFVCGYLNDTRYEPIFRRHLERYSDEAKDMYGNPTPMYKMAWMDFELFKEILFAQKVFLQSVSRNKTHHDLFMKSNVLLDVFGELVNEIIDGKIIHKD